MAIKGSNMPYDGNSSDNLRSRVADLNAMFRSVSRLEASIAEDELSKELDNLNKIQKYKKQILEKQQKLEADWLKKRAELEKKASKEEIKLEQQRHEEAMANVVEEYKAQAELTEKLQESYKKIGQQYKGTIGSLIGAFKKSDILSQAGDDKGAALTIVKGLSTFLQKFDSQIEQIASYQNKINTRLFGSGRRWDGFGGIASTITATTGLSPYVKTADVMRNVDSMVQQGIAFNVEQRAFLNTIKDSIATTFDAANGTLLQLIRIQQADTTAARLGMEAALNQYLNSMFKTTEYLNDAAAGVKSSIYEASALMSAQAGVAFEYQVQKWLGSLYSVGMSQQAVSNIATALGQLGSGDVTSLTGTGMQNLLVMSASRAGLSYSDILTKGLDESGTNQLLQAMVDYLATIASDNRVVQSAYARIFGLSSSDIVAASTLAKDTGSISKSSLDYGGAMGNLRNMMDSMAGRVSIGGMLSTVWENLQYNLADSIAANPALYAIYKSAGLLDELAGGIPIPYVSAAGFGVDLETTVADIMRAGVFAPGLLGAGGKILSSLAGALVPSAMLGLIGSDSLNTTRRGRASTFESGATLSSSIYRGQQSSEDIYEATMTEGDVQKEAAYQRTVQAEEEEEIKLKDINMSVQSIYDLLNSVISLGAVKVSYESSSSPWTGER